MEIFKQGDVVRVPFPYTDRNTRQHRPALVVSKAGVGDNDILIWVVMITSAENRAWPGDIAIKRLEKTGLSASSTIRAAKVATVKVQHAEKVGEVDKSTIGRVLQILRRNLFGLAED